MKKIVLLLALCVLTLSACGDDDDSYVGKWIDDSGLFPHRMELYADGTGISVYEDPTSTIEEMGFEWEIVEGRLCLTYSDDSESCNDVSVEGDRMSLGHEIFGELRYERWPD